MNRIKKNDKGTFCSYARETTTTILSNFIPSHIYIFYVDILVLPISTNSVYACWLFVVVALVVFCFFFSPLFFSCSVLFVCVCDRYRLLLENICCFSCLLLRSTAFLDSTVCWIKLALFSAVTLWIAFGYWIEPYCTNFVVWSLWCRFSNCFNLFSNYDAFFITFSVSYYVTGKMPKKTMQSNFAVQVFYDWKVVLFNKKKSWPKTLVRSSLINKYGWKWLRNWNGTRNEWNDL